MRRSIVRARTLFLVLILALAGGACVDAGELGGPTVGGTVAARVGDVQITNGDIEAEVERWATNPDFLTSGILLTEIGVPGRRASELVAFALDHLVRTEMMRQATGGYEPTDAEVDQVLTFLDTSYFDPATGDPLFPRFDEDFRRRLAADLAVQQRFGQQNLTAEDVPVEINPKYGVTRPLGSGIIAIVPHEGSRGRVVAGF